MSNLIIVPYPAGKMTIYLDAFFPCTVQKGRKLFRLIKNGCSDDEIKNLYTYLQNRAVDARRAGKLRECERCQKNADLFAKITGIEAPKDEKRVT